MIIIFVEHYNREFFIAKKIAKQIKKIFNKKVYIYSLNFVTYEIFCFKDISFVITPNYNILVKLIVNANSIPLISLNYEQMLSPINHQLKKIKFNLNSKDIYIAWSNQYRQYLLNQRVPSDNILLTSRPQDEICLSNYYLPLSLYKKIISKFGPVLGVKNIVFIPLTCLQAFKSDYELKRLSKNNNTNHELLHERKSFVVSTLIKLYTSLCKEKTDCIYIIRPHPGVSVAMHEKFLTHHKLKLPDNVWITTEYSPYNWMSISNVVVSNYSSLVLESRKLGIKTILFNTKCIPSSMRYEWFKKFDSIDEISEISDYFCDNNYTFTGACSSHSLHICKHVLKNKDNYQTQSNLSFFCYFNIIFSKRYIANIYRLIKLYLFNNSELEQDYFKKISY